MKTLKLWVAAVCLFAGTLLQAQTSELFFSEYVEGSSFNKALEIYNGTGTAVDLAAGNYVIEFYFNGRTTPGTTIALTGTVAAGDVYVVADDGADAAILAEADQTSTRNFFNGDDAIVLRKDGAVIDVIGQVGFDPGSQWGSGLTSTKDNTLRRKASVVAGDTDETDAFDPALEWDGYANNTFDGLGSHESDAGTPGPATVLINEVDADTPGSDKAEFIELFDGGSGNTALDGLVVVLYNGNGDKSYRAFDLDGYSTDANGYFLMGNSGVSPTPALVFGNNTLQNGADAVALYQGDAADFPSGTPVTTDNLIDAIVYDTNDADDAGLLVLLNPGQPQVNEGGAGDKTGHSNQRIPNGSGGARNTETYAQFPPTPGAENVGPPPGVLAEIFEIQGSGMSSPLVSQLVITENNIVTAVAHNGFYMQTPDDRSDGDAQTSDGIFVYTGGAPGVAVGDMVNVTGDVIEFYDLTEIGNSPEVTVVSSGHALPAVVDFDASLPSPNQPQADNEFERFEGMRVRISNGMTTGPTDRYGDIPIVAASQRAFREKGIVYPGLPNLPVWDGNPEIFELDPDGLGLPNLDAPAGKAISNAVGVLTYRFGDYQLVPTQLSLDTSLSPRPVRAKNAGEATIATQNLLRLFDDVDDPGINEPVTDPAEYDRRLKKFSLQIRTVLGAPDILAVQEAENLNTLQDLADQIQADDNSLVYTPYLAEGNDIGGIDVGFLVRNTVNVSAVYQIGKDETFEHDGQTYTLHDRPPYILEGEFIDCAVPLPITVMAVHLRSLSGIDGRRADYVRTKRNAQAVWIAERIQQMQEENPDINLVVTGDFNAFEFTDGYVDVLGQITGNPDPAGALVPASDIVNPDLRNRVLDLPAGERYSFVYRGNAQVLDHVLTSQALDARVTGVAYGRGNADAPRSYEDDAGTALRSSDHDGLVLYLRVNDPIANTVLFATEHVYVRQTATVASGNIMVNSVSTGPFSQHEEVIIDSDASTPACFDIKANRVRVQGGATVASDVYYNTLVNNGTITGAQTGSLQLPLLNSLPQFIPASPGSDDILVNRHQSLVLAPGQYATLYLEPEAEVVFTGGHYHFDRIVVEKNSALLFEGESQVHVARYLRTGLDTGIQPAEDSAVSASDILFYIGGGDESTASLETGLEAVVLGKNSTVQANFYAPSGTIWMRKHVTARGSFWAQNIVVGKGSHLEVESWFDSGDVGAGSLAALQVAGESREIFTRSETLPTEFSLQQNYPNPFNPSTVISFDLKQEGRVRLVIYNTLGQKVRTLVDDILPAGRHRVTWSAADDNGAPVAAGLYLLYMEADGFSAGRKMLLTR